MSEIPIFNFNQGAKILLNTLLPARISRLQTINPVAANIMSDNSRYLQHPIFIELSNWELIETPYYKLNRQTI